MTDTSTPWEGELIGDSGPYSALEWARVWRLLHGVGDVYNPTYGVIKGTGGGTYEPLSVIATNPVSVNVELHIGAALVNGRLYETDAAIALTVQANISGNPRIDTVILRVDYTLQTITPVILQGSPAVSPVAPTLQQDTSIWEMALADIAVANGFATISQSDITQRQRSVINSAGWQPFAYPLLYDPIHSWASTWDSIAFNNGDTLVVPVVIHANFLLDSVSAYLASGGGGCSWAWDIYLEDLNAGLSAQNILRRVARSNGVQTFNSGGANSKQTLSVMASPIALTPGIYWLAIQRQSAGGTLLIVTEQYSNLFSHTSIRTKNTTNPNGDTLDFVAVTWTSFYHFPAAYLNGRVFGETTAYV